ncbi:DUF411 domain-containing protein [Zoogloea sp.]|uniref:DUF411 domain-containing protein n=1 Tax=Zoogloea sp. TaxID=49181 RepID=UPI00260C5AEB|nr:DUF411 domain-containing protein [Zoogloea sp.]
MKLRPLILTSLLALTASAALAGTGVQVDVYKSPYCGCCTKWVEHLRSEGFEVKSHNVEDVPAQRARLGMPETYGSCHTARIGNYLVEGHVPAADVRRLLKDKPKAIGLAVPSMPPGSPGMESAKPMPYETLLISANGSSSVFARH